MAKTAKTTFKTTDALRKGFRAYVGMYGAAYERVMPVYNKAVKNYDDYAARGEKLETFAGTFAKDARTFATKRFEKRTAQLRSFLPGAANDRVQELETEISKLNKKIISLSKAAPKKLAKRVTKVTKKATNTVKAA